MKKIFTCLACLTLGFHSLKAQTAPTPAPNNNPQPSDAVFEGTITKMGPIVLKGIGGEYDGVGVHVTKKYCGTVPPDLVVSIPAAGASNMLRARGSYMFYARKGKTDWRIVKFSFAGGDEMETVKYFLTSSGNPALFNQFMDGRPLKFTGSDRPLVGEVAAATDIVVAKCIGNGTASTSSWDRTSYDGARFSIVKTLKGKRSGNLSLDYTVYGDKEEFCPIRDDTYIVITHPGLNSPTKILPATDATIALVTNLIAGAPVKLPGSDQPLAANVAAAMDIVVATFTDPGKMSLASGEKFFYDGARFSIVKTLKGKLSGTQTADYRINGDVESAPNQGETYIAILHANPGSTLKLLPATGANLALVKQLIAGP